MMSQQQLKKKTTSTTRWSDLDYDLLLVIFEKLSDLSYIYRCGTVCVSWQYVSKTILHPFLLLPKNITNLFDYEKFCTLFNIRTHKIHKIPLPEEEKGNIWYSSSGFWWLITIGVEPPHEISLFNPFTRDRITLPLASDLLNVREKLRVITSTNPLIDPKFSVLATHSCGFKIAFCRPGDSSWTSIKGFQGICNDTIFHKGEFYAVNHRGDLFRINRSNFTAEKLALRPIEFSWHWYCNYLVESDGDLLLVARRLQLQDIWITCSITISFEVYKLNWDEKGWIQVKNFSNNAILLGKNSSKSLPPNHSIDFEANCIYFIDDADVFDMKTKKDTGLYNIVTRQFKRPSPNCYNKVTKQLEKLPSTIWESPLNWFIP